MWDIQEEMMHMYADMRAHVIHAYIPTYRHAHTYILYRQTYTHIYLYTNIHTCTYRVPALTEFVWLGDQIEISIQNIYIKKIPFLFVSPALSTVPGI